MANRPTVRGVWERARRTSRRHWRALLLIAFAIFIPIGLLDVLDHHFEEGAGDLTDAAAVGALLVAVSHALTALLGEVLFAGVVAAAVSETHGGEPPPLGRLLRTLPYGTVIVIDLLFSLGLALTLLLLVVPGVVFFGRFALAGPLAKIEGRGVRSSFRRSRELTRHHLRLVLLVLLPIVLGGQLLSQIAVGGLGALAGESFLGEWAGATLSEMIAAPLWALAAVALTFELIAHERD